MENQTQPDGSFVVQNDSFGQLLKAGEVYADIVRAKNENTVVPAPAASAPAGMTPGTVNPAQALAMANNSGPFAGMSNSTKLIVAGVAVVGVLALVIVLARRK